MKTFKPKDYIVTKDGLKGYVIKRLDHWSDMYEIRIASGITVRRGEDLELDPLMGND